MKKLSLRTQQNLIFYAFILGAIVLICGVGYLIYLYEITGWKAFNELTGKHLTFWQYHALKNIVVQGRSCQ